MPNVINIQTEEDTKSFARTFAKNLKAGDIILLYGDLGAGKTFFTREVIRTLTKENEIVPSPTFTILQTYENTNITISHYDLYRLETPDEAFELDIDNALKNHITIIEWPQIIEEYINNNFSPTKLIFNNTNDNRTITIE